MQVRAEEAHANLMGCIPKETFPGEGAPHLHVSILIIYVECRATSGLKRTAWWSLRVAQECKADTITSADGHLPAA